MSFLKNIFKKKTKVLSFVRMNPPTNGHEKVINQVMSLAKKQRADHEIIASASHDPKKNPLYAKQKLRHLNRAFPNANIELATKELPSIMHHAAKASKDGYKHLHVVVGADRVKEFSNILNKYNGPDKNHNFKSITVHEISRPEGAISATKMRSFAKSNDFNSFRQNLPTNLANNPKHAKHLFIDVKRGMKIKND